VSGDASVGGLTGRAELSLIERSYARGAVSGTGSNKGAFVGTLVSSTINTSFANSSANSGLNAVGNNAGASGVTLVSDAQLQQQSTYRNAGWDFTNTWKMGTSGAVFK